VIGSARAREIRPATLAGAVLAVLVAGAVAGLFYAQAQKREDPLLLRPQPATLSFRPTGALGRLTREAHIRIETSVDEMIDVTVVTSAGRVVAVLAHGMVMHKYRSRHVIWAGGSAPPGIYLLRVRLERARQTLLAPGFRLRLVGP